jgi:Diguanylate cyclase, GGDEF domain
LLRHALTAALIYWLLANKDNAWPEFAVPSGPCSGRRRNPKGCEVAAAVLRPKDVFGRLGGEEFVVLLLASSIEAACARAERVRGFFAQDCRFARECHVIATVSGGMSASVKSEQTLEELLHVPTLRSTVRCKGPRGGTDARYRKAHATRNTFDIPPSGSGCSDRLMRFRRPWRTTDPRPPPT